MFTFLFYWQAGGGGGWGQAGGTLMGMHTAFEALYDYRREVARYKRGAQNTAASSICLSLLSKNKTSFVTFAALVVIAQYRVIC